MSKIITKDSFCKDFQQQVILFSSLKLCALVEGIKPLPECSIFSAPVSLPPPPPPPSPNASFSPQVYSLLVYRGPGAVPGIKAELAALLKRDGFSSVAEAVGADHRTSRKKRG